MAVPAGWVARPEQGVKQPTAGQTACLLEQLGGSGNAAPAHEHRPRGLTSWTWQPWCAGATYAESRRRAAPPGPSRAEAETAPPNRPRVPAPRRTATLSTRPPQQAFPHSLQVQKEENRVKFNFHYVDISKATKTKYLPVF